MTSDAPGSSQRNHHHTPHQSHHMPAIHLNNNATSPPNRRDLKSWWKGFKLPSKHQEAQETRPQGIFGVPLRQSITYANVAISLIDDSGQSYIYGYVPIVVAKCGVFLKEKATAIEGIFRLSGSEKRIKELKIIFDSPDRYGKGLVWDGYTVHDAANVLRRYLNDLPEPVVPLDLYEKFRDPLRGATKQAVGDTEGPQFVDSFDEKDAIKRYQRLITELPPLNRQLLLYILDLLAVFAAKADENRMNSQNLAAIFQPGMLSHPSHAMAPEEYRLNQCVIIFLIENQDHFLIGMQGTAADEETKKQVEAGTPGGGAMAPGGRDRATSLDRSASNASAGANSVRRDGKLRRNRSVSSRNSGSSTPNSPALTATPSGGGLGRSNTVPSKKSPALAGGRFQRHDPSSPHSPSNLEPLTQLDSGESTDQNGQTDTIPVVDSTYLTPTRPPGGRSHERLLDVPQEPPISTPSKEPKLSSIFQRSPNDGDKRQPNKLKKKRAPGSMNPSAHSSSASLHHGYANAPSPPNEISNPLDHAVPPVPAIPAVSAGDHDPILPHPPPPIQEERHSESIERFHEPTQDQQLTPPASVLQPRGDASTDQTPRASQASSHLSLQPEQTLKGKKSPPTSLHSSFNEGSDLDQIVDEQQQGIAAEQAERERKKRWRLSRGKNPDNGAIAGSGLTSPRLPLGSNDNGEVSSLSVASSSHKPRKSESSERPIGLDPVGSFDSAREKEEAKGPIGWIRNKYREAKENAEQRRNKSPPADRPGLAAPFAPRGKSLDIQRDHHTPQTMAPPLTPTVPQSTVPVSAPVQPPTSVPMPPSAVSVTPPTPATPQQSGPVAAVEKPIPAAREEPRTEQPPQQQQQQTEQTSPVAPAPISTTPEVTLPKPESQPRSPQVEQSLPIKEEITAPLLSREPEKTPKPQQQQQEQEQELQHPTQPEITAEKPSTVPQPEVQEPSRDDTNKTQQ